MDSWDTFVAAAIDGEPDDPFVHLLRERIAAGSTVVSVELTTNPEDRPEYRVVLERLRELSVMVLPHSASFTRWSLGGGVRMANHDQEARRVAILVRDRFQRLAEEHGAGAHTVLVERVRLFRPPRTMALLAQVTVPKTGIAALLVFRPVDDALSSLAAALGGSLHYPLTEAAALLDAALELYFRVQFLRDLISPLEVSRTGT